MDIRSYFEGNKFDEILTKKLTRREVEVLSLYASGWTYEEIAEALIISENTVKTHLNNVYMKILIPENTSLKSTLYLFYGQYRTEITKMGGYLKNGK